MKHQHTPKYSIGRLIEPTRIFITILLVAVYWIAPVVFLQNETLRPETSSTLGSRADDSLRKAFSYNVIIASAQGCGPCQEFGCIEWINNENPDDGSNWTTCIRDGCVSIPACVPMPPTATLSVTCDTPGQGGWCQGGAEAELTVTNSQGQNLIISGNVNGNNFTCASAQTPCIVPLPEGTGTVTYVISTDAGFTTPYSAPYQVDATTPQIDGNINGSVGTSGWYTTQAVVTASALDALSGIASFELNVDNTGWTSYSDTNFTDGIHTIQFRATDNAGNQTETAFQQIKVDATIPDLSVAIAGSLGSNQWFVSAVTVTPKASDALSGLTALEVSIDGGSYSNYQFPITFSDGVHSVQFRAIDQAGNISQTAIQQINVDTVTPGLSLSKSGTSGLNPSTGSGTGWYISNVSVTPTALDSGSGINKVEALIDNGSWTIVNGPLSFSDGIHTYQIRVTDNAGNVTQTPLQTVKVDTLAPALTALSTIGLGSPLPYQISDTTSGLAWFQVMVEDKEGVLPATGETWGVAVSQINGEYWWDGKVGGSMTANVGSYPYRMMAADQAGNQATQSGYIEVEWKDLLYLELIPTKDNTPQNATGGIVLSNSVMSNEIPSAVPATPEASFGGENNGVQAEEETTVATVTGGEQVFEGMTVQTGSAISFTVGNETTNIPNSNLPTTVLWGAAASALLGATLAEWQKKKEEDAALLAQYTARSSDGGGDEEEEAGDVAARKRAKKLKKINPGLANAEAQAKAVKDAIAAVTAQELKTWERDRTAIIEATDGYKESENKAQYLNQELQSIRNAEADYREEQRIATLIAQVTEAEKTDDEKLAEYKQSESYLARQESYAEYYVQKEKEEQAEAQRQALIAKNEERTLVDLEKVNQLMQNNVDVARWTGVVSVSQTKQESEKPTTGWFSSISLISSALSNVWQMSSLKAVWDENANKSTIIPGLTTKNILTTLLVATLGYNSVQWISNIATDPYIFDDATKNLIVNFQQFEEEHPHTEENSKFSYFITNPYEFVDIGYDAAKAFFNSAAGYADAIWQENPAVQSLADLATSGDSCSTGWGEAWDRRCSAFPYFLAGVMENPADTAVGVATSLAADPTVGLIKFASYNYEYNNPYQPIADLYQSVQEYGLINGVVNVIADRLNGTAGLLSDPEVQSFGILAILALLPLAAAPLLGIGASTLAVIEGGLCYCRKLLTCYRKLTKHYKLLLLAKKP